MLDLGAGTGRGRPLLAAGTPARTRRGDAPAAAAQARRPRWSAPRWAPRLGAADPRQRYDVITATWALQYFTEGSEIPARGARAGRRAGEARRHLPCTAACRGGPGAATTSRKARTPAGDPHPRGHRHRGHRLHGPKSTAPGRPRRAARTRTSGRRAWRCPPAGTTTGCSCGRRAADGRPRPRRCRRSCASCAAGRSATPSGSTRTSRSPPTCPSSPVADIRRRREVGRAGAPPARDGPGHRGGRGRARRLLRVLRPVAQAMLLAARTPPVFRRGGEGEDSHGEEPGVADGPRRGQRARPPRVRFTPSARADCGPGRRSATWPTGC